jgi:hypothetical protein
MHLYCEGCSDLINRRGFLRIFALSIAAAPIMPVVGCQHSEKRLKRIRIITAGRGWTFEQSKCAEKT